MYGHFEEMKWAEFNAGNATFAINDPSAFDPNLKAQAGGAAVPFSVDDVAAAIEELDVEQAAVDPLDLRGETLLRQFSCRCKHDVITCLHRQDICRSGVSLDSFDG